MTTEVQTTNYREAFRAKASAAFHAAADMSLHELVDEYLRLSEAIEAGTTTAADEYETRTYSDEARIAMREVNVVNGAAKARFGIAFSTYDRDTNGDL